MAVECPYCERPVIAEPRGWAVYDEPQEGPAERWTLGTCQRAGHVLLILQLQLAYPMAFEEDTPSIVYPIHDRQLSWDIPDTLRRAHEESRKCYRAKAYKAAVVMAGRTLEGACKQHGVTKGTLQNLLAEMKKRELIDKRLWEWAESLRSVRNAAAHYNDEAITKEDAEDAIAYSEALLDYLYVLTARFEAMKRRRAKEA
jgi:hypothetical protein